MVHRSARLLPDEEMGPILEVIRCGTLQVYCNLSAQPQQAPEMDGAVLFCSEAECYGGQRRDADEMRQLLPYECIVVGSASWGACGEDCR